MKKILVMAALATLVSTSAFAVVSGTAHDLSSYAVASSETCVFCHTPHGANTAVANAPLWNRSTAPATGAVYAGVDLEVAQTLTAINATDAPLCLSCHDGTVAEVLANEPNAGATDASALVWASADANLDTVMSNDHPIGMNYVTADATDTGLVLKATVEASAGMTGALSFGGGNDMWCSSCHDVHDDTNSPFLRKSNAASALCTTCHIK